MPYFHTFRVNPSRFGVPQPSSNNVRTVINVSGEELFSLEKEQKEGKLLIREFSLLLIFYSL